MRCSSTAGFHGRSMFTSVEACCRFRPVLPASVDRNTRHAGSLRNWSTSAVRFSDGQANQEHCPDVLYERIYAHLKPLQE